MPTETKEFTIVRTFDAPRELVFDAWTDPEQMTHWWGPKELTTPRETISIDLREGGRWSVRMVHPPSGYVCPQGGLYREIDRPERLVFTWGIGEDEFTDRSVVTIELAEVDGRTRMTFHQIGLASDEERENVTGGWSECLDKFAEYIERAAV
ncbi:SRPBCC family protein [Sciscionella marina]|uniref:SRPBCC family protein n=1 Tax=Sciscionella marina TaxID=508770 RepID=UPI0003640C86|nr:SRPBCC domain-containing protein [Sciscionella marina]